MRRFLACLILSLTLAGCGAVPTNTAPPANTEPSAQSEKPSGEPSATPSSLTKHFGSTFTWDDGSTITIGKPTTFKPSQYAAVGKKYKRYVVMDVKLKNGTDKPIESLTFTTRATTGDEETDLIFDTEKGIDFPTSKILPGKSLKYKVAYGVKPGEDFVVTVEYGFGNGEGYYKD